MKLSNSRQRGQHYEQMAADYLCRQGLTLIEKNFTCRQGELDLIMKDRSTLVFVEVKYRNNQYHGHAAESVTPFKMQKLIKAANLWMMKQGKPIDSTLFRFDVVAIHQQGHHIDWIKNAITQG